MNLYLLSIYNTKKYLLTFVNQLNFERKKKHMAKTTNQKLYSYVVWKNIFRFLYKVKMKYKWSESQQIRHTECNNTYRILIESSMERSIAIYIQFRSLIAQQNRFVCERELLATA